MNIRTLCLGILHIQDATGYEINKLVADGSFSHFIEASYGSIYPTLTKMMAEELVTCREETQEGRPARKVYSITDAGRQTFIASLEEPPQPDRFKSEFLFFGLFAKILPTDHLRRVIDQQEQRLVEKMQDMREWLEICDDPGSRFAIGYGLAAKEAALRFLQDNKNLLLTTEDNELAVTTSKKTEPTS